MNELLESPTLFILNIFSRLTGIDSLRNHHITDKEFSAASECLVLNTQIFSLNNIFSKVVDVTWRYSANHNEVIQRRSLVREEWLLRTLELFNEKVRKLLDSSSDVLYCKSQLSLRWHPLWPIFT